MISQKLLDLKYSISTLSSREKIWLLECIARQLRDFNEAELFDMANDPEVQAEIATINREFSVVEMDGRDGRHDFSM
ncbi:MAG: hypothetical protein VKJ46_03490 [Leptolyngbyaceae bacterium]|nr:hypothetical protein [Leptolyngbyaceae bacterium]